MKNTQTPQPSTECRIFAGFTAVSIVALTGYAVACGAFLFGASVFLMGFTIRNGVLLIAQKDREFNAQFEQDKNENNL